MSAMPLDLVVGRWPVEETEARWEAFRVDEREAFLRYGHRQAPWESVPDVVERLCKSDPNLTIANARLLATIFRTAYDNLVSLGAGR